MSVLLSEAETFIRIELRAWKIPQIQIEWRNMKELGLASPWENKIILSSKILSSSALLTEIVRHEIAHILDYNERGTFLKNGKNDFHGKNWKKWCLKVGCRPRRFIPV